MLFTADADRFRGLVCIYGKVTNAYTYALCRASPREPIPAIFGTFGDITNVSNYAKFHVDRSRHFRLTGT
jgi:hypothetical protein